MDGCTDTVNGPKALSGTILNIFSSVLNHSNGLSPINTKCFVFQNIPGQSRLLTPLLFLTHFSSLASTWISALCPSKTEPHLQASQNSRMPSIVVFFALRFAFKEQGDADIGHYHDGGGTGVGERREVCTRDGTRDTVLTSG